jgi:hypothetical protein
VLASAINVITQHLAGETMTALALMIMIECIAISALIMAAMRFASHANSQALPRQYAGDDEVYATARRQLSFGFPRRSTSAHGGSKSKNRMQTRDEHPVNHECFSRDCLDEFAARHAAAGGGSLSALALLTLTSAEIDYLHARICKLGPMQARRA